jgi:hypothetical protein
MHVYEEILMEVFRDFEVVSRPAPGSDPNSRGGYDQRLAPDPRLENRDLSVS